VIRQQQWRFKNILTETKQTDRRSAASVGDRRSSSNVSSDARCRDVTAISDTANTTLNTATARAALPTSPAAPFFAEFVLHCARPGTAVELNRRALPNAAPSSFQRGFRADQFV
jgi:hypothetical protein